MLGTEVSFFPRSHMLPLGNKGYHGDVFYLGLPRVRLEMRPRCLSQTSEEAQSRAQWAEGWRVPQVSPLGVLVGLDLLAHVAVLGDTRGAQLWSQADLDLILPRPLTCVWPWASY